MAKQLKNLRWQPRWVSYFGCVKGCLDYLGVNISDAWLYGVTGHAFIINMHEVVCPSGPTAWGAGDLTLMQGRRVGYVLDGVTGLKAKADFAEKQKLAWDKTRQAIDEGLPCYGWELDIPEFYVVYGYDDQGYHFSGPRCESGKGPKPWQELGNTEIGWLEMASIKPCAVMEDNMAVKEAFEFVLDFAQSPTKWVRPPYKAGIAGFDNWITALKINEADGFGMAYNAAVWSECRTFGVAFLKEAKDRLDGSVASLFEKALGHYQVVAENLNQVAETFPFHGHQPEHMQDETRRHQAIKYLSLAREAEAAGLKALEKIVAQL